MKRILFILLVLISFVSIGQTKRVLPYNPLKDTVITRVFNSLDEARKDPIAYCKKWGVSDEGINKKGLDTTKNTYYHQTLDYNLCILAKKRAEEFRDVNINYKKMKGSTMVNILTHETRYNIPGRESLQINARDSSVESELYWQNTYITGFLHELGAKGIGHRLHLLNINNKDTKVGIGYAYLGMEVYIVILTDK
jgi:hypothetical protein